MSEADRGLTFPPSLRPCRLTEIGKVTSCSQSEFNAWMASAPALRLLHTQVADGHVETGFEGEHGIDRCFWSYWVQGSDRRLLLRGEQEGHLIALAEEQHERAIQEALRDWFSAPSFPDPPLPSRMAAGSPLSGETIRSTLCLAAASPPPDPVIVDAPPRRMQSLRYRLMKRLSRGPANWYEILDALTTDDAHAVRTMELAWEHGLLRRIEGSGRAAPPSFELSPQALTFLRQGRLTMHEQGFADWKDDVWAPGWEPWKQYFCPLCGARGGRTMTMRGNVQVYCTRGSRDDRCCTGEWFLVLRHDRPAIERFERGAVIIGIDHMRRKTHIFVGKDTKSQLDRVLTRDEAREKLDIYTLFS